MGYDVEYYNLYVLRELFLEVFPEGQYHATHHGSPQSIIDCGANIGMSVLYFKYFYPNVGILAFEPVGQTFEILHRNVERNPANRDV